MTIWCEVNPFLRDFSGFAPIFPLPHVVLFPHATLPLHIFEPRYRKMVEDALIGEQLIAMGLLQPGWQLSTVPPVHRIMGIGKITNPEKLSDGRYNLELCGLARVKLVSEKEVDLPYRIGQFEICRESLHESSSFESPDRTEQICKLFQKLFPMVPLEKLFVSSVRDISLQEVCDTLLGVLPMPSDVAQRFLEELDIDARGRMLFDFLTKVLGEKSETKSRKFPPDFSSN